MMVTQSQLTTFLDGHLRLPGCQDSSNNGLQVEGGAEVRRVVVGVDACLELFEQAAARGATYIIVHHGMSWRDQWRRLQGVTARRLELLFQHKISLYASHLPLDAHPVDGNNARLATLLGLTRLQPFFEYGNVPIGFTGELPEPISPAGLARLLDAALDTRCRIVPGMAGELRKIAVVSGGAGDAAEEASRCGCDALVTGEINHSHLAFFQETGITGIAAGHYATETLGVRALGERLADTFGIPVEFIDLPTGL